MSMPEVAKICSDEYQKLSEKSKAKYKNRWVLHLFLQFLIWYSANTRLKGEKWFEKSKSVIKNEII